MILKKIIISISFFTVPILGQIEINIYNKTGKNIFVKVMAKEEKFDKKFGGLKLPVYAELIVKREVKILPGKADCVSIAKATRAVVVDWSELPNDKLFGGSKRKKFSGGVLRIYRIFIPDGTKDIYIYKGGEYKIDGLHGKQIVAKQKAKVV